MPCRVEFRLRGQEEWIVLPEIQPGGPKLRTPVVSPSRESYLVECGPDDTETTIYCSRQERSVEASKDGEDVNAYPQPEDQVVKVLRTGEVFEVVFDSERAQSGTYRFTHE